MNKTKRLLELIGSGDVIYDRRGNKSEKVKEKVGYITIDLDKPGGFDRAEKLVEKGWKVAYSTINTICLYNPKVVKPKY